LGGSIAKRALRESLIMRILLSVVRLAKISDTFFDGLNLHCGDADSGGSLKSFNVNLILYANPTLLLVLDASVVSVYLVEVLEFGVYNFVVFAMMI